MNVSRHATSIYRTCHGCFIDDFEGGVNVSSNIFYRVLTGMTAALLFEWFNMQVGHGKREWGGRDCIHTYTRACLLALRLLPV